MEPAETSGSVLRNQLKSFSSILEIWATEMTENPNFLEWWDKEEARENCRLYIIKGSNETEQNRTDNITEERQD